ncbi:MAG: tRNA-binding protein [Hyphomicrobiales bacterium]|nr:tRNA-binding protein [Hyphomicrobiales bacterium]MCY4048542.1 tRNA-binding protein [Hyphomicrobiales bacterium]MCY4053118.1 tRNA-binding protein [Hyphomicrobiales bacterium]
MSGRDKEILPQVAVADFFKVDVRLGRIVGVEDFPEARKPAYKLCIDFGEPVGTRKSSAQITKHYKKEGLLGRKVWCVVNFPPRQIGPFVSEVLVLGGEDAEGAIVLAGIDDGDGFDVPVGASML